MSIENSKIPSIENHPLRKQIEDMIATGATGKQIYKFVRDEVDKHKEDSSYVLSRVSCFKYLKCFKSQLLESRRQIVLQATGKDKEIAALTGVTISTIEVSDRAQELVADSIRDQIIDARKTFSYIHGKCAEELQHIGSKGFVTQEDHRIIQGYLQRLESVTISFGKALGFLDGEGVLSATQSKMVEAIAGNVAAAVKEVLSEMDPSLLPRFFTIWRNRLSDANKAGKEVKVKPPEPLKNEVKVTNYEELIG